MNLAPIGLSTYKRHQHLANTLTALASNTLAKESELFIFSDAPKPGDEQSVAKVRSLIQNVPGFKKVHVFERKLNDRVFNNRGGMKFLLSEFGRMIYLEEDVVTAPAFLGFINEGLEEFNDKKSVFSVCGYTPPLKLNTVTDKSCYTCRRFSAWGFGMWADRYAKIEMNKVDRNSLNNLQKWRLRSAGTDLVGMVDAVSRGEIEALDVRINFTMARDNLRVVCPTVSLTLNRGHDGTGIHCGISDYFETDMDDRQSMQWDFQNVRPNWKVDRELFFFRGRHIRSRKNLLRYYISRNFIFGH